MIENLKEKLSKLAKKIETSPWYVRVFIGSWVSLYTALIIWFFLTSWNTALYEGETLKLLLIDIAFYLGFIWAAIVVFFNIYIRKIILKKILISIHFIILVFLIKPIILLMLFIPPFLTHDLSKFTSYHPMVMGYELSSLRIPSISSIKTHHGINFEVRNRSYVYSYDHIYSAYRFIYHYNTFYYLGKDFLNKYITFISYMYSFRSFQETKEELGDIDTFNQIYVRDVWRSADKNIYKIEYLNYLENIINIYKDKIKKLIVD